MFENSANLNLNGDNNKNSNQSLDSKMKQYKFSTKNNSKAMKKILKNYTQNNLEHKFSDLAANQIVGQVDA